LLTAVAARLRQLRQIADDHAGKFRSDGLRKLFATLQHELDDEYFEEISGFSGLMIRVLLALPQISPVWAG
jgi:hypothetical protein